jgi:nicotinamidase/pyrazinamidase
MEPQVFWDVDTQRDFIEPDGALYIPGAETIVGNLERLTRYARANQIRIVASVDHHAPGDTELAAEPDFRQTFPPHCLGGTPGSEKIAATTASDPLWIDPEPLPAGAVADAVRAHGGELIFRKQQFDVFSNANVDAVLAALDPAEVVLYGVALDVCDAYAIDGLLERGRRVVLVEDAVWPIDPARGAEMIERWRQRGVRVVRTQDLVADDLGAAAGSG